VSSAAAIEKRGLNPAHSSAVIFSGPFRRIAVRAGSDQIHRMIRKQATMSTLLTADDVVDRGSRGGAVATAEAITFQHQLPQLPPAPGTTPPGQG
jgi:hypothetical protein